MFDDGLGEAVNNLAGAGVFHAVMIAATLKIVYTFCFSSA
jgi:hypothetical protein